MRNNGDNELTASEIEAEIDRDRAAMAASIRSLRDKLSVDGLMDDGLRHVQGALEPGLRHLERAIAANPVATAVVAVGVAWLIMGWKRPEDLRPPIPIDDADANFARRLPPAP